MHQGCPYSKAVPLGQLPRRNEYRKGETLYLADFLGPEKPCFPIRDGSNCRKATSQAWPRLMLV